MEREQGGLISQLYIILKPLLKTQNAQNILFLSLGQPGIILGLGNGVKCVLFE